MERWFAVALACHPCDFWAKSAESLENKGDKFFARRKLARTNPAPNGAVLSLNAFVAGDTAGNCALARTPICRACLKVGTETRIQADVVVRCIKAWVIKEVEELGVGQVNLA